MKRIALFLLLAATVPLCRAEDQPKHPDATVAALKLRVAEQVVEIAQLRQQLIQAQAQLLQLAHNQNETELKSAQDALKAEQTTEKQK